MRGVQFAVLTLFWAIAILMIVAGMNFFPALRQARTQDVLIKTDVYMMSSAMDAAQSYLGAALQYSNYQACYELLKKGGNSELTESSKISYDNVDYGTVPERQAFMDSLKSEVQKNLNAYSAMGYSFAKKYPVELPGYAVVLTESADGVSAKATADKKMSSRMDVKGGNLDPEKSNVNGNVIIYRTAGMDAKLMLDCLLYYDRMKVASDDAKSAIANILQDGLNRMVAGVVKDSGPDCGNVKAEEEVAARKAMTDLSGADKTVEVLQLDIKATLNTPFEPEKEGPDKGKYICKFTKDGASSATAKVVLKGSEKVPVWNGEKIKYEPLDAIFAIKAEY